MAGVLSSFGLACSLADEPAPAPESSAQAPRIVLLLSLDALRPDHLGVYGHERFTSPVIDALAAEGVVFEDVTSTSPWR